MRNIWYYQYTIKVCSFDSNSSYQILSGVVAADKFADAVKIIEDYYGNDIIEILGIKCLCDVVIEFNEINKNDDCDFYFSEKVR